MSPIPTPAGTRCLNYASGDSQNSDSAICVSVLQAHHTTLIDYPSLELLRDEDEDLEFAMTSIQDSAIRYDPTRPLVDDTAVEHHAGRNNKAELRFYSITAACFGSTMLWAGPTDFADKKRLLHDMRLATSGNGGSTLKVVTYTTKCDGEDADEVSMIRIQRRTWLKQYAVAQPEEPTNAEYNMTLAEFDSIDPEDLWMVHIQDLIHGRSDRAVRYVAIRLQEQGTMNPASTWKPPRLMKFEERLTTFAKPVNIAMFDKPDVDRHCMSCASDMTVDAEPLALLCNDQHIVCKDCIIQWCNAQGPALVGCPFCRRKLLTDQATIDELKFGVHGKTYARDARYDNWENFERSYADLDAHLAEDSIEPLTVNSHVLSTVWDNLAARNLCESQASTPFDLQAIRAPECGLLREVFRTSLKSLHGVTLPTNVVYKTLLEDIHRALPRAVLRSSSAKVLSVQMRNDLVQEPLDCNLGLREGFMEFIKRMISRMIRFAHLRNCDCGVGDKVFHYHGWREYYDLKKALNKEMRD